MRQKSKLFIGNSEADVWGKFQDWLETSDPVVVPNLWFIDLQSFRIAVVYSEQIEIQN